MASKYRITAGQVCDIEKVRQKCEKEKPKLVEDWIFVDIGFAPPQNKSCGVAIGTCEAEEVTFAELVGKVTEAVKKPGKPLNLLLESPLSMAFDTDGNPQPRIFEWSTKSQGNHSPKWSKNFIDGTHRGWYYQAGATTRGGAERLIWELHKRIRRREIRLFEGFVPRKKGDKQKPGDHAKVAAKLRNVVKGEIVCPIVHPHQITDGRLSAHLWPITGIEGWDSNEPPADCMIPPVVWIPSV